MKIQKQDQLFCHYYKPDTEFYDEMMSRDRVIRRQWQNVIQYLQDLTCERLRLSTQEACRMLSENGVTYNIYGDSNGFSRLWELDSIPMVFGKDEWVKLEAGLTQRAELFNHILDDIYGEMEIINKRLVPLELIYGHGGFLRPCRGVKLLGKHQLFIHAVDVTRAKDGSMIVLEDRTQAPSGAGYALENRTVIKRIFSDLFKACRVHHLSFFFNALKVGLYEISPYNKDNPRIVMMTPGPRNETYFEHAYLASYLGFPLVQGSDLTVRDGRVWLKSIEGLQQVDIIFRRVDDSFCDPLELRGDSFLGVAGLTEAARRGNVAVVNPLGSGVLENPGLLPFLPKLAKHFLGEELIFPSTKTWWCGRPKDLNYVLNNLNKLVIKSIYRRCGDKAAFCSRLSKNDLASLREKIKARPYLYVGQEEIAFSTVPCLADTALEPRHAAFRFFLVAENGSYALMQGGLTRAASDRTKQNVSNQAGGISKDTWVLIEEKMKHTSLWLNSERARLITSSNAALPSQAAENLFWVGRYAERAEDTARLLRTVFERWDDSQEYGNEYYIKCFHMLLETLTHFTMTYPGFVGADRQVMFESPVNELFSVTFDKNRMGSLKSNLSSLTQSAYNVRDLWSGDTWHVIDMIKEEWLMSDTATDLSQVENKLDHLINYLSAFTGLTMESLNRSQGWQFLDIGRRLERSLLLSTFLRYTVVPYSSEAAGHLILESVLSTNQCLNVYRRRYRAFLDHQAVIGLLLLDETNPRSLVYQADRLQEHIKSLPMPTERFLYRLNEEERLILEASTKLRLADPAVLAEIDDYPGYRRPLDILLTDTHKLLSQTFYAISHTFFSHAQTLNQLISTTRDNLI